MYNYTRPLRALLLLTLLSFLVLAGPARADDTVVPKGLAPSDWSSIRAAYEAGRHAAFADDANPGHYRARNPGQQWITKFDGRGFTTIPTTTSDGSGWTWGLDLISYGRSDAQHAISGTAKVQPSGTRVEYVWSDALTEWYINDQRGFEHGYTLNRRPEGANGPAGMLHFTLGVRGDLLPRVSENGRDVAFQTAEGGAALTYNNLRVFDADGVHLAASFRVVTSNNCTPSLLLTVDDTNARYPLTIDPTAQQAYLKAARLANSAQFGNSVAVSANTVVVGASAEDSDATGVNGNQASRGAGNSGAAYVFFRSGTTWTQQAYLKASNTGAGDQFGCSVSIQGDTIVVGAFGEDSNATGVNGNQADNSAVGAGAAYVFVRSGTIWTQQAYLKASNAGAGDAFGSTVSVWLDTIVVGASSEDSNATGVNGNQADNSTAGAGAAYVFVRSGTTWTQQAYLKASNTGAGDAFGISVCVNGATAGELIVVGAFGEDSNATGVNGNQADNSAANSGAAYVFFRSGTTWTQEAYLKASNTGANDSFGYSVAMYFGTVVVGARGESSNATGVNGNQNNNFFSSSGAAYLFVRSGTTWIQEAYLKASNTGIGDEFGRSVAIFSDTVVVGADSEDSSATGVNGNQADDSISGAGAAYVFVRSGTIWTQQAYLKASNTEANDWFSHSVAVSNNIVVVGAIFEDSNATGIDANQADNSAAESGAAYVFVRSGTTWTQQAYLKASNTRVGDLASGDSGDQFGSSVAVSGETVVVGAIWDDSNATGVNGNQADNSAADSGAAYVFVRSGTTWTQQAYLKASNTETGDNFGYSVAVSGDTVVVGANNEASSATGVNGNQANNTAVQSGAAYVFVRSSTIWTQQAYLKASNTETGDNFGISVAVSGDTVVIGTNNEASSATGVNGNQADNIATDAGAAYVFFRSGTTWTQQAYLKASNTGASDFFGFSVAVSGDTVVVGAYGEDSSGTGIDGNQANNSASGSGAAYVFFRSGTTWSQQAYFKASNTGAGDNFGYSAAVSGDTVVIGARFEDGSAIGVNGNQADNSAGAAGAAYVFFRSGTTWTQQAYLKASNTGAGDNFGYSAAVSGDTVVVGARFEGSNATGINGIQANNSATDSGAAYAFRRSGITWSQQAYIKASNTGAGDQFGYTVAVSGETVVVGAPYEDSNAAGINGNQADNSNADSGAAYIFLLGLPTPTNPLAAPVSVCSGDLSSLSVVDPGAGIVIDWFTGSCGGALIGTGNPFNVITGDTTTYYARARRTADGNTSDACASVAVTVNLCRCQPADIACDDGTPLPPFGPGNCDNSGVNEGDYNAFFQGFFDAASSCDIADDSGNPLPPFNVGPTGDNTGVNEGDYNCFFQFFFNGCP